MFNFSFVATVILLYIGLLFLIALWTEKSAQAGRNPSNHPLVYSLSLAVYCTSWTYYGSVGKAANSGLLFLAIYLGPTLAIVFWGTLLRRMVALKNVHHVTSIADFISLRYDKSQAVAALATVIALVGITPYLALQLKAVFSTFEMLTLYGDPARTWMGRYVESLVVGLMILFTIVFGARRLDPTERHQGVVMAVAVESLVKLAAFLAVGLFVTYSLYGGFGDIFRRAAEKGVSLFPPGTPGPGASYLTWTSYLVLAMSAIMFLPRQFHVAVVENFHERHIRTAMWVFPLYMLVINIFVVPIALAGLLAGHPAAQADLFVLRLPMDSGLGWLTLLVFLGGFSAATAMIMVNTMTLATMVTNHLLLPLVTYLKPFGFLRRHMLECRWLAVALGILTGYWFERILGKSYLLVNIGLISFAAVLQFAPPIIGGLLWRGGSKAGALGGMGAGFLVWAYTMLVPTFVQSGWLPLTLLQDGPFGLTFLAPESLFGLSFDPVSHTVFWSLTANLGLYVLG
ncbi:MAG: diguanylate cyclase, partial [Thermodesulfobacteriota bacterium]